MLVQSLWTYFVRIGIEIQKQGENMISNPSVQQIVTFTKPEAWKKTGPVADLRKSPWSEFVMRNPQLDLANMTSMRYFLRVMGESSGFNVKAMHKAQLPTETFARHYQHIWKYPGALPENGNKGWALDMVNLYSSMPLWFFLIEGNHDEASRLRGPTDGNDARNLSSSKYSPFSIRGIFGADKFNPQFHMTDVTPYAPRDTKEKKGEFDACVAGRIEAIRFFKAGELQEEFVNWPLVPGANSSIFTPMLRVYVYYYRENELPAKSEVNEKNAKLLMNDFVGPEKYQEFFGGKLPQVEQINFSDALTSVQMR